MNYGQGSIGFTNKGGGAGGGAAEGLTSEGGNTVIGNTTYAGAAVSILSGERFVRSNGQRVSFSDQVANRKTSISDAGLYFSDFANANYSRMYFEPVNDVTRMEVSGSGAGIPFDNMQIWEESGEFEFKSTGNAFSAFPSPGGTHVLNVFADNDSFDYLQAVGALRHVDRSTIGNEDAIQLERNVGNIADRYMSMTMQLDALGGRATGIIRQNPNTVTANRYDGFFTIYSNNNSIAGGVVLAAQVAVGGGGSVVIARADPATAGVLETARFHPSGNMGIGADPFSVTDLGGDARLQLDNGLRTGQPTGGTVAPVPWRFGNVVAAAAVLDGTRYLEVSAGGVLYKLALIP